MEWQQRKDRALKEDNYIMRPLAAIPELDLEIYSRCIVCRVNDLGEFANIEDEDFGIWKQFLSE